MGSNDCWQVACACGPRANGCPSPDMPRDREVDRSGWLWKDSAGPMSPNPALPAMRPAALSLTTAAVLALAIACTRNEPPGAKDGAPCPQPSRSGRLTDATQGAPGQSSAPAASAGGPAATPAPPQRQGPVVRGGRALRPRASIRSPSSSAARDLLLAQRRPHERRAENRFPKRTARRLVQAALAAATCAATWARPT